MRNLINEIKTAKKILVPKGDDSQPCTQAFEDTTGIIVPEFDGRKLIAKQNGVTFYKVKGIDIPGFIAEGYGDIGLSGSDSCEEYLGLEHDIIYQKIGRQMCRFALLSQTNEVSAIKAQLEDRSEPILVATSYPKLLGKCALEYELKLKKSKTKISGSLEAMPKMLELPLVADIVSSGETAQANGLEEVMTLLDIYPSLVAKNNV